MVGLVIVSHSYKLAEGVKELAAQMTKDSAAIAAAGGLAETLLGTDAARVLAAIEEVYSEEGVLVLIDLGSAELSARLAVEMLPAGRQSRVIISPAALVEGAVAAALEAALGGDLEQVQAAAESAAKISKLAAAEGGPIAANRPDELLLTLLNPSGLHARPAALFVQTAGRFQAKIEVRNLSNGSPAVNGKSILNVVTIGAVQGSQIAIRAAGDDAPQALEALRELVENRFGE